MNGNVVYVGIDVDDVQYHGSALDRPPNPPALNDDGLPIAPMTWAERLRRVLPRR